MKKIFLSIPMIVVFTTFSTSSFAQGGVFDLNGYFFVALLAGILLAFGFQTLLTLLSVAAGINIAGPFNKSSSVSKNEKNSYKKDSKNGSSAGPKISSAVGAWTLLTLTISLFFASWLSIKLTLVESNTIGIVLGLVIWATFFTTMMYLEMRSISSLAGGLFNVATGAIRSSFQTVKSAFETSQAKQVQNVVDHSVDKIRQELSEEWHTDDIITKLDEYVEQLKPEPVDYDRIENELKNLIDEIEIEHRNELGTNGLDRRTFINIAEKQPNLSKDDVKKVGGLFDKIKSANQEGATKKDKVLAGIDKLSPGSEHDTTRFRQKIANYLRDTQAEEVQPEKLEQDLEMIINEPKSSKEVILNRVSQLDKETLVQLVKGGDRMDDAKARNIVNKAEGVINKLKAGIGSATQSVQQKSSEAGNGSDQAKSEAQHKAMGKKIDYEMKLRTFFNSMQRPEFNYERIKLDFIRIFRNPKAAPGILKSRFQNMNRDSLVALMSKNKNMSRQDAENMLRKFDDAREQTIRKAEEMEHQVISKYESTRQTTLDQFEAARKTAATAAWWLAGAAIVSGAASALGGILAITI